MSAVTAKAPARRMAAAVCGAMLIAAGTIAVVTGDFTTAGIWVLVAGLAAVGLTGVVGGLRGLASES